jgi:hypothetical protein
MVNERFYTLPAALMSLVLGTVSVAQVPTVQWHRARLLAPGQCSMAFDSARQRVVMFTGSSTWEWDGSSWVQLSPSNSPAARSGQAMAYDSARRRVVLFGGIIVNAANPYGITVADTWEWDGDDWMQRLPAVSPSARHLHAMAYDSARQRIVLHGGHLGGSLGPQVLGDTWEWDGATWTQSAPSTSPGPLYGHAMVYDAARRRVLLHGGEDFPYSWTSHRTFEWDGVNWTQRAPGPARYSHVLAYDAIRQRVVLFGGVFRWGVALPLFNYTVSDETWEWDGSVWTQQSPAVHPGPLSGPAMVYDGASGRVLLFAGEQWEWDGSTWRRSSAKAVPAWESKISYDNARQRVVAFGTGTWEWDGRSWSERRPATHPGQRGGHTLFFDPGRQRTVLFGGAGTADTWEWDGANWTQLATTAAPSPRWGHALAYDALRSRAVLFGGDGPAYSVLADTWEWNGNTWTQIATATAPGARSFHAMAYDPVRQRIVLFGGYGLPNPPGTTFGDTWEYDGSTWTQRTPATSPSARRGHAMATDGRLQRAFLHGGWDSTSSFYDTWEWDGVDWAMRPQPAAHPEVYFPTVAYDDARAQVVLLGPRQEGTDVQFETWLFGTLVPATVQVVGAGCAGSQGPPVLTSSAPYLGHPAFRLELSNAPPNASCLFGIATSAASQPLGGGCVLRLGSPAHTWFAVANAAGFAEGPRLPIPFDPALWGLALHAQSGVLDSQAPLGFTLSAGRMLVVGA